MIVICLRCGDRYDTEDVYAYKFCDDCFADLDDPDVKVEDYYAEMHPERALEWKAALDQYLSENGGESN